MTDELNVYKPLEDRSFLSNSDEGMKEFYKEVGHKLQGKISISGYNSMLFFASVKKGVDDPRAKENVVVSDADREYFEESLKNYYTGYYQAMESYFCSTSRLGPDKFSELKTSAENVASALKKLRGKNLERTFRMMPFTFTDLSKDVERIGQIYQEKGHNPKKITDAMGSVNPDAGFNLLTQLCFKALLEMSCQSL